MKTSASASETESIFYSGITIRIKRAAMMQELPIGSCFSKKTNKNVEVPIQNVALLVPSLSCLPVFHTHSVCLHLDDLNVPLKIRIFKNFNPSFLDIPGILSILQFPSHLPKNLVNVKKRLCCAVFHTLQDSFPMFF